MKVLSIAVLLLLGFVSVSLAGECGSLAFTQAGAKQVLYNLDPLADRGSIPAAVTTGGQTYNFNIAICKPLSEICPKSEDVNTSACYKAPSQSGGPPLLSNAAVCQHFPIQGHTPVPSAEPAAPIAPVAPYGTNCFGQYTQVAGVAFQVHQISDGLGGVSLTYLGGDVDLTNPTPYTSTVNIHCNKAFTAAPLVASAIWTPGQVHAIFDIQHIAGCPLVPKKHLSGGSVCLIILSVAVVLYIAGGIAYNRYMKGRSGSAMFPNHTFWSNLPGLVRDGFRFIICQPPIGANAGDYERVEG